MNKRTKRIRINSSTEVGKVSSGFVVVIEGVLCKKGD